ncbi:hypothetical protein [Saliterribacillus persicus]|uniref:Extracellular solute-binding protein n=1 Tax=Saliterribacillus persicus TaxID=930114 RepID=A0A368Y3K3_9BACI|nr:hypothetical protein [Saliterribacillus persicus]RCW74762.1 hypothetical protein DFR57_10358 [Saliterribacillus persicus]
MKLIETLKTMHFKEAVDYIWEYYKIHIMGIIFGLFVIGSILSAVLKENEPQFNVTIVGAVSYEVVEPFQTQINEEYFEEYEVAVDNISHRGGTLANQSYEQVQKLVAKMSTGMIDVFIGNEDFAKDILEQEGIVPLNTVMDESLLEGTTTYDLDTGEVYAVNANDFDVFDDYEAFEDMILFVPATAENKDFIDTFFKDLKQ